MNVHLCRVWPLHELSEEERASTVVSVLFVSRLFLVS